MRFEWDEEKNRTNLEKHGIDFSDAWEIFQAPLFTALDTRRHYGEERWIGIGLLRGRAVVVAYTEPDDDTIRVISLRKAVKRERIRYEQFLEDRLG